MKTKSFTPVILGKPLSALKLPANARKFDPAAEVIPPINPVEVIKTYKKTPAGKVVADKFPDILEPIPIPAPLAGFRACGKSGTAAFLDIWDCDHFDGITDMGRNLSQCRVWFSAAGYTFWGSSETKSGRINCYFRAPETRMYRCDATLQSHGSGPAVVECVMDDSSFGFLNVNGTITQPHYRELSAGFHSFRIRQVSGSFFFLSLTVYAM